MLSSTEFKYYQPHWYKDDGTNIEYGDIPDELYSFQAFVSPEACREWLWQHDYNDEDFTIDEYENDEIEGVTIIDEYGDELERVEDIDDTDLAERIVDVVMDIHGFDSMHPVKRSNETQQEYEDRIYTDALDMVNDAICRIESNFEYNLQSYAGSPEDEWYDTAREYAVQDILRLMTEEDKNDRPEMPWDYGKHFD
jgi:hypothetical protein